MKPAEILQASNHRPWPLPTGGWVMRQTWRELLFAHWPVGPEVLRPLIPAGLTLDTFEGRAWIGIVPFRMTDVRLRACPPIPTTDRLPEINVRTYVTLANKPGVWFLSLDAGSPLAVAVARATFFLPYFRASFSIQRHGETIEYASRRLGRGAPPARFAANYAPLGPASHAPPGTLADWLTARYCLYSSSRAGQIYRGEIHHAPWTLAPASAEIGRNTLLEPWNIRLPDVPPLLHYAEHLEVLCWPLRRALR
ncbi:MAG TPA: DUF2071 domain-containing protein [Ktedonobacterales bacterium]|jgi:hypothetical protein|nr:DUF2071 domain-containing protein [Ktedonobacterales bacterium]